MKNQVMTLRRQRRNVHTLDSVLLLLCAVSVLIVSVIGKWGTSLPDAVSIITHASIPRTPNSDVNVRQTVVVSTTIPNEEDFVIANSIQAESRRLEILEQQYADEIAEEERLLEEQRIAEEKQAYQKYVNSIICDPSDISRVSGLKEGDYALLTKGTWWEGHEDTLYKLESEHGVNAMFAMSVSSLESGLGTSVRARSRRNYYGIELDKNWESLHDNTLWWGGMINRVYVDNGTVSVWNIGPIYCPPNREWEVYMNDRMTSLYNSLITNLTSTVQ